MKDSRKSNAIDLGEFKETEAKKEMGKWSFDWVDNAMKYWIFDENKKFVCATSGIIEAKRIVNSVNACAEISNEELENGSAGFWGMFAARNGRQRDRLLSALKGVLETGLNGGNNVRLSLIAASRKELSSEDLSRAEKSEQAVLYAWEAINAIEKEPKHPDDFNSPAYFIATETGIADIETPPSDN